MTMETPLSSDILAISALVTSLATFVGVVVQLVNSFRNTRKIDATHDIAVQTFQRTGGINVQPKQE
jgi:hypothetical protein